MAPPGQTMAARTPWGQAIRIAHRRPDPRAGIGGQASLTARRAFGPDYEDPVYRAGRLDSLLADDEIDWRAVRDLLAIMDEPLGDKAKAILLRHLHMGPNRTPVVEAFCDRFTMPPSCPRSLPSTTTRVPIPPCAMRPLNVLARLPGGDNDDVATQLASRLAGTPAEDMYLLRAIAQRSGTEATRALVRYIEEAAHPDAIATGAFATWQVVSTPEAMDIAQDALSRGAVSRGHRQPLVRARAA